jgi:hypothetical protein
VAEILDGVDGEGACIGDPAAGRWRVVIRSTDGQVAREAAPALEELGITFLRARQEDLEVAGRYGILIVGRRNLLKLWDWVGREMRDRQPRRRLQALVQAPEWGREEAPPELVDRIVRMSREGCTQKEIGEKLNRLGEPPLGEARDWSKTKIGEIIRSARDDELVEEVCGLLAGTRTLGEREANAAAYLARTLPDTVASLDGGTLTLSSAERDTAAMTTRALDLLEIDYEAEVERATQRMRIEIVRKRAVLRLAAIVAPRITEKTTRHHLRDTAIAARWGRWRVEKDALELIRRGASEDVSAGAMAKGLNQQKFLRTYPPPGGAKDWSPQMIENALRSDQIETAFLGALP